MPRLDWLRPVLSCSDACCRVSLRALSLEMYPSIKGNWQRGEQGVLLRLAIGQPTGRGDVYRFDWRGDTPIISIGYRRVGVAHSICDWVSDRAVHFCNSPLIARNGGFSG